MPYQVNGELISENRVRAEEVRIRQDPRFAGIANETERALRVQEAVELFENSLVQVQAKRWLHSVGRKEVAELRGSLQPFARGAVITTSHFSKAAINEASEEGKNPVTLVDGFRLSKVVLDEQFHLAV